LDSGLENFIDTGRRFARREVAAMVGTEGRDGNLAKLPELLNCAYEIGLLANADPQCPGFDYGIWGRACNTDGPMVSTALLEEIAAACPGVAACLHFLGLGAIELEGAQGSPCPASVAFFESSWRVTPDVLDNPPGAALKAVPENGRLTLSGEKSLVPYPHGCTSFVVYGAGQSGWERVFVPADSKGLEILDAGMTVGLSALKLADLKFENVTVAANHLLPGRNPSAFLRRAMLGLAAIAIGNGRAALEESIAYARERYQGGTKIINQPAVQVLLGDASSRVAGCSAALKTVCGQDSDSSDALLRAVSLKLRASVDCWQAISDCLQVLGGYGYMEDFRLEKRLRDAMHLKVLSMRPDDLRIFCGARLGGAE
jgi:alkylation response protein AidB-like acyl-CoA dehydrogenase